MNVEVLTDAEALAERSVEVLIRAAEVAIEERGLFVGDLGWYDSAAPPRTVE